MAKATFDQLRHELHYTVVASERVLLLQAMADVGNFHQLRRERDYLGNANEREILTRGMTKFGTFDQLRRELHYTLVASERVLLLQAMADVGNFHQLRRERDYLGNANEREILIRGMTKVPDRTSSTTKPARRIEVRHDVFIAHASEDKKFVTPLALALMRRNLDVWYDDFVLKAGDSLRREIDKGLAQSRYGLVILSHHFFNKHYPQKELDGLTAKERLDIKVIIPIWHNINREDIEDYSPTLADIKAIESNQPTESIVDDIIDAIS